MKAKITKRLVDDTPSGAKPVVVFDTDLAGFVLKVLPTGKRIYQLRYRMGGRQTPLKTFTLGAHGVLTAEHARRTAQMLLGDVRRGIDPAQEKVRKQSEDRGARTVADLSAEFLEIYARPKLKPRSYVGYARAFRDYINPKIGLVKVRDVAHGDIERLHHGMRAIPTTANRTMQVLSKFFSWTIKGGYRPDKKNPCRGLEKFREQARERYLSPAEIGALGEAIRTCEALGSIDPWQAALFRSLMLTGMRRGELQTLKWAHIDNDRMIFALPDSKTGKKDVPITPPVQQILVGLPRLDGNPFVFPGRVADKPTSNLFKAWARIIAAAKIAVCTICDTLLHPSAWRPVRAWH